MRRIKKLRLYLFNAPLVVFLAYCQAASAQVITRPYIQVATPGGVVIRWNTEGNDTGKVKYGPDKDLLWNTAVESRPGTAHEMTISGLQPSTRYYYSIDTLERSDEHYFITAPSVGTKVKSRIWVISDFGQTSTSQNSVREEVVDHWKTFNDGDYHADLVLSLGDQTENDTREELQQTFFDQLEKVLVNSPLYTIEGNHDAHDEFVNYKAAFTIPSRGEAGGYPSNSTDYYSFDYANVHVICLSTEIDDIKGPQLTWLRKDLQNIDKNNTDWLIACLHRPFHSGGYHTTDNSSTAQEQRDYWLKELENYGVDLVLQGHNAIYERSFLLDNLIGKTTDMTDENMINGGDGREDGDGPYLKPSGLNPHQGTVIIEVAPGGDAVSNNDQYQIFTSTFSGKDVEGSLVIDIDSSTRMDVSFLCYRADDQGNHIRDHFTILKSDTVTTGSRLMHPLQDGTTIKNYPNPFCSDTNISYWLEQGGHVKIDIYDVFGRKLDTPLDAFMGRGEHTIGWSPKEHCGSPLPFGLYIARLSAGNLTAYTRMVMSH